MTLTQQEIPTAAAAPALPRPAEKLLDGRFPGFYEGLLATFRDRFEAHVLSADCPMHELVELNGVYDGVVTSLVKELDLLCVRTLITAYHEDREQFGATYRWANEEFSRAERRAAIFSELPELLRLVELVEQRSLNEARRILDWVWSDYSGLQQRFGQLGRVTDVTTGLGDPHAGGKTVAKVQWESGATLVVKPRNPGPDSFLLSLARSLDPDCSFFGPVVPDAEPRTDHLWQEYVEGAQLPQQALAGWYRKLGRTSALLFSLGATDIHFENLVCTRQGPVLIDAETVTSLPTSHRVSQTVQAALGHAVDKSVLRTWIFPTLFLGSGIDMNISAIGGTGRDQSRRMRTVSVVDPGTDAIRFDNSLVEMGVGSNEPHTAEGSVAPQDYLEDVLLGFQEARELLLARSSEVERTIRVESPGHVRQVFRPTWIYGRFLNASTHPDRLRSAEDRQAVFAQLPQDFFTLGGQSAPSIYAAEVESLLDLDVPIFEISDELPVVVANRHRSLDWEAQVTTEDCLRWWWANFVERDPEIDESFIRKSMSTISADVWSGGPPRTAPPAQLDPAAEPKVFNDSTGSQSTWLTGTLVGSHIRLAPISLGLYESGGSLLEITDRGLVTGRTDLQDTVRRTVRGAVSRPISTEWFASQEAAVSAVTGGLSDRVTVLELGRRNVVDHELLDAAHHDIEGVAASLPDLLADTSEFDFLNGLASTFVALTTVPNSPTLSPDVAESLHSVLKDRRDQLFSWTAPVGPLGVAHGWAGRMLGLVAAGRVLARAGRTEEGLDSAINHGLDRYLRQRPRDASMQDAAGRRAWCKGAPGIVVGLLHSLRYSGSADETLRRQIAPELEFLSHAPPEGPADISLCHGAAGQIAVLTWVGRHLDMPQAHTQARRIRDLTIEEVQRTGWRSGLAQVPDTDAHYLGRTGWDHIQLTFDEPASLPPLITGGALR